MDFKELAFNKMIQKGLKDSKEDLDNLKLLK